MNGSYGLDGVVHLAMKIGFKRTFKKILKSKNVLGL